MGDSSVAMLLSLGFGLKGGGFEALPGRATLLAFGSFDFGLTTIFSVMSWLTFIGATRDPFPFPFPFPLPSSTSSTLGRGRATLAMSLETLVVRGGLLVFFGGSEGLRNTAAARSVSRFRSESESESRAVLRVLVFVFVRCDGSSLAGEKEVVKSSRIAMTC